MTKALVEDLGGIYGYTESDEISILLPKESDFFDREVEKLVSIAASTATCAWMAMSGIQATFDARVCVAANTDLVVDYFNWRQADATRCALNGMAYWTLRQKDGLTSSQATSMLKGKGVDFKNELLFQRGINFNDLETWKKRGTGVYWEKYFKKGFNPKTNENTIVERRRLIVDENVPENTMYGELILDTICGRLE